MPGVNGRDDEVPLRTVIAGAAVVDVDAVAVDAEEEREEERTKEQRTTCC